MKPERKSRSATFAGSAAANYGAYLHRFLARRMHRQRDQDVEDLVQEVYVSLLEAKNTDLVRNPVAYCVKVASRVAYKAGKREQYVRQYVVVDSELVEHAAENPAAPPVDALAKGISTQRQLSAAISKLPPLYQAVIILFHRDGKSYAEIAKRLNRTPEEVGQYLASARKKLMAIDWEWD